MESQLFSLESAASCSRVQRISFLKTMKPRARANLLAQVLAVGVLSCNLMAQVTESGTNALAADAQALAALAQQIQEQHKATMWFLDQLRQNIEDTSTERDQAVTDSEQRLQQTLATQAQRQAAWVESSHWLTVVTAGCIGGMALMVMVLTAAVMNRALSRRTELTAMAAFPPLVGDLGSPEAGSENAILVTRSSSAEQTDRRLRLAIERLEKRVAEMENQAASVPGSARDGWVDR
jgi:hypothetical protein